jgi:NhaP-type Na+/H+ or K+/H+ antiporter
MVLRMAAVMSLLAFALCLVVGALEARNPFGTTVQRALVALVGTLVIGLVIGTALRSVLNESLRAEEEKLKIPPGSPAGADR